MTTLDDKLLGEKTENYCSSSSDDDGGEEEEEEEEEEEDNSVGSSSRVSSRVVGSLNTGGLSRSKIDINDTGKWKGYSHNTGPKGVIRDWQLYKEHEASVRMQEQAKLAEDIKKHAITCKSYGTDLLDAEMDELMSDDVLKGFVDKRMGELIKLQQQQQGGGIGGGVSAFKELANGDEFLDVIDKFGGREEPVVVVIFDDRDVSLRLVQGFRDLSLKHLDCQFCCVRADSVGVSSLFLRKGVPAVLVYKRGELVGNYVRVVGEIGDEFDSEDLGEWLEGKGVIGGGKRGIRGE